MQELERIRELVHEIAGVPGEQVTPESTVDSLNLDSLDVTELILSVEDEFGIIVDDESSIHSVGDLLSTMEGFLTGSQTSYITLQVSKTLAGSHLIGGNTELLQSAQNVLPSFGSSYLHREHLQVI